jgi:hypothetical protein
VFQVSRENQLTGASMRSLTEQVTFKVSRETLQALQARGRELGLDANPFARKLVDDGLSCNPYEALADELRELLASLRPLVELPRATPSTSLVEESANIAGSLQAVLVEGIKRLEARLLIPLKEIASERKAIAALADNLLELRADLNKTFAALLHYQMGFSVEDAQHWVDARLRINKR